LLEILILDFPPFLTKRIGIKSEGLKGRGTLGIIDYTSQSNDNTNFIDEKEKFKFIDDLSVLEVINLILQGIYSFSVQ
jgi:hypothetical protein